MPAPPRTPWPENFPPVIAHVDQREMREHPAYRLAKDGLSDEAALTLVYDLINDTAIERISNIINGREVRICGVHAEEAAGRNKIPMAYAEVLAHVLDQFTDPGIVQSSVANHGGAQSIYHRMVSQPAFEGYVEPNAFYMIVDDTCTAGGTLANLKGFIEVNGGRVLGMSVLAKSRVDLPYYISLAPGRVEQLRYRHKTLDEFWIAEYGYGLDCLTDGEAGHLFTAPSVDTIRNRLAEARRDLNIDSDEESDQSASGAAKADNDEADDAGN